MTCNQSNLGNSPEMVREISLFETLLQQFEKANSENTVNLDRLVYLTQKLNSEPSPYAEPINSEKKGITTNEGLLTIFQSLIYNYQDKINLQNNILIRLEKLV